MKKWKPKTEFTSKQQEEKYMRELIPRPYDPINYLQRGWKHRYYNYMFNMKYIEHIDINDICHKYLKTLEWNLEYYLNDCPSWNYYYPYLHSPCVSDIYYSMKNYVSHEFEKDIPCSPFEQLMCVLPPQSSGLLPKSLGKLMTDNNSEISCFYPWNVGKDDIFCNMVWQIKPKFPPIDVPLIKSIVNKNIKNLSKSEILRNELI